MGYLSGGTVSNSYAAGAVSGGSSVGGLVGYTDGAPQVSGSYYDTLATGQTTSAGGTGMTTVQTMQQATFRNGWDFNNTWFILEGRSYPFQVASSSVAAAYVDPNFNQGAPGWGVDHFARVQEGIDAVKAGGNGHGRPRQLQREWFPEQECHTPFAIRSNHNRQLTMSTGGVVASGCNLFVGSTFWESGGSFTSSPTAGTFTVARSLSLSGGVFNRFTGSSTSGNPFLIYDVYGLQAMEPGLNSNYQLANDVDASTTANDGGAGFAPVGNMGTGNAFAGSFYGAYHKITGLYINRPTQNYVGLFGSATTGTFISRVGLVGER